MLAILTITFPIFGIIALGYALCGLKVFDARDMGVLGKFVLLVALPALLFHATATRSFSSLVDPAFLTLLVASALCTQLITWTLLRLGGVGPGRRAIGTMGSATPNSAFLSFPIMQMVFPNEAPAILAMNLLVENFLLNPIGLTMIASLRSGDDGVSPLRRAGAVALSVLKRPFIIAIILGTGFSVFAVPLPEAADHILDLLARAASPVALFFIGGSLYGLPMKGNIGLAGFISGCKLLLHPAVATCLLLLAGALALPLPPGNLYPALILSNAMPVFGIFPILAQGSGHEGAAALTVTISTALAFLTLTVFLALLV
ncbi:AEC family transporter [Oceanicola sp. S124]|uniref:AEC family transporter n=1 Tax=Oceanicola sp. S124 TaxID=1042378 RepID=UPI0002558635|nr:AEC family transporter [Oceanicola sp. S124]